MSQCKAIKNDGEQCSREARDGLEYCAIPAHSEQEQYTVPELQPKSKNKYGMVILDVGAVSAPEIGAYSGEGVVAILQEYHDRGYELISVLGGEEKELANSLKYTKMVYTFKLRE